MHLPSARLKFRIKEIYFKHWYWLNIFHHKYQFIFPMYRAIWTAYFTIQSTALVLTLTNILKEFFCITRRHLCDVVSKIIGNSIVCLTNFSSNSIGKRFALSCLCKLIRPVEFPHKFPVMWKSFPCHDAVMVWPGNIMHFVGTLYISKNRISLNVVTNKLLRHRLRHFTECHLPEDRVKCTSRTQLFTNGSAAWHACRVERCSVRLISQQPYR